MHEQFVISKHGASFHVAHVAHNSVDVWVRPLTQGRLSASVGELVARSQASIARFYLVTQQNNETTIRSLIDFFRKKGWYVQGAISVLKQTPLQE